MSRFFISYISYEPWGFGSVGAAGSLSGDGPASAARTSTRAFFSADSVTMASPSATPASPTASPSALRFFPPAASVSAGCFSPAFSPAAAAGLSLFATGMPRTSPSSAAGFGFAGPSFLSRSFSTFLLVSAFRCPSRNFSMMGTNSSNSSSFSAARTSLATMVDRRDSRATSFAHVVRYRTNMPDARLMAERLSLDMLVVLGRDCFRRRRMHAAGGSNSTEDEAGLSFVVDSDEAALASEGFEGLGAAAGLDAGGCFAAGAAAGSVGSAGLSGAAC
mmetsp:Transcript_23860/g.56489  ORF Transcript_23860/g.56489 Transcript_23860/m.56489 type:complete len:276 (+) Transcript_23860:42-869(+)